MGNKDSLQTCCSFVSHRVTGGWAIQNFQKQPLSLKKNLVLTTTSKGQPHPSFICLFARAP